MTEQQQPTRRRRRRVSPGILLTLGAYLCVLVLAVQVDGLVEAQAQQRALTAEAEAVRASNQIAVRQDRTQSLALASHNARVLADIQSQASSGSAGQGGSEASTADNKPADTASSSASGNSATVTVPETTEKKENTAKTNATGKFQAGAYANGFAGESKVEHWKSINNDVIGYLHMPGTNISHAVVQNNNDVNYYTHRGYYKEESYYGVLWTNPNTNSAGSSSSMSSNTVVYGHNWTNFSANPRIGSANDIMFGQLTGYHYLSMAQSYPYFYYSTEKEDMVFKIFAVFYTEPSFRYNITEGISGTSIQNVIDEARSRSRFKFDVEVDSSDKLMTLSTCTRAYGATSNQRFVVMGRLLRPGETVNSYTISSNPNHKQPDVWNK